MRMFLLATLCVLGACAAQRRSGFVVPPQDGLLRACPTVPKGENARIRLVALSELGDTIRSATVRLDREPYSRTLELQAPDSDGVYNIGPLVAGKYDVTVTAEGHQSAHMTATFCNSSTLEVNAVLAQR